ncbi:uncharacterized protein METZ01_LOCUS507337, partial [marine metagenome]
VLGWPVSCGMIVASSSAGGSFGGKEKETAARAAVQTQQHPLPI